MLLCKGNFPEVKIKAKKIYYLAARSGANLITGIAVASDILFTDKNINTYGKLGIRKPGKRCSSRLAV